MALTLYAMRAIAHVFNTTTTTLRTRTTASVAPRRAARPSSRTLRSRHHMPRASKGGGFLSGLQAAVVGRMGTR